MRTNPETNEPYLTLELLRLILVNELCIPKRRVWIYNQKLDIPKDKGLFVNLEYRVPPQTIAVRDSMDQEGNENQNVNMLEEISIVLYSRDLSAVQMKEQVMMALHSMYAQQLQEAQSFKIFRNSKPVPVHELEGTAILYRFDIECRVQAWYNRTAVAEFFDSIDVDLWAEGRNLVQVEFVIPDSDPTVYPK